MKSLHLVCIILLGSIASVSFAQPGDHYRVVRVVGHVESSILKREFKTEDIIPDGDKLKFKGKEDYLVIFHPRSGRKRIQGVPDEQPRELNLLLQSFLRPDHRSTGTRDVNTTYKDKLKASLKDKVLMLGTCTIDLDPNLFPIKPPATIKAQYRVGNQSSVTITVLVDQTIHLDKKTLFPNATSATPTVLLMYFLKESSSMLESEDFLGNFTPVYVEDTVILPEVRTISESLKGSPADSVKKYVTQYLTQEYGKPQPINLEAWLKSHHLVPEP